MVINGSTTTSTIEIPNTMLNDSDINTEELVSQTNVNIVNENQNISKNIYELLYINFVNSIIVQDRNSANYQDLPNIASMLNQSICRDLNYDNIKLTKWRITFNDNSTSVGDLTITEDYEYSYVIQFTFFVSKLIKKIELISEDESITYLTINQPNVEQNKIYNFSQDIYITYS